MPDGSMIQRSFTGGEIAPALYARADQVKYQTGLRTCRNFLVRRHGGVANRSGTQMICEMKDSTVFHKSKKFVFNNDQTYVLLFGHLNMRVVRQGVLLTVSGVAAWSGATNYVVGDLVVVASINYYCILAHLNHTPPNATYWYPLTGSLYEIPTPYIAADVAALYLAQSADVVSLDHASYPPMELRRTGHTAWTLVPASFAPAQAPPTAATASGTAGSKRYRYRVTAVSDATGEESTPSLGATVAITGITQANPPVVTAPAHPFQNGDEIYLSGIVGMTTLNGYSFVIAGVAVNVFSLVGVNSTTYPAYVSGGTAQTNFTPTTANCAVPTVAAPITIVWTPAAGAQGYNVYREIDLNGVYGYMGSAWGASYTDTNAIIPDALQTPPLRPAVFGVAGQYPACVGYFQQRRWHGNTGAAPQTVFGSNTGFFANFTVSSPLQASDTCTFPLVGKQVNTIQHIIDIGNMIVLTSGSEWVLQGDGNGAITPSTPGGKQYGYNGASAVPPVIIGNNLLYIQARGNMVRDFRNYITQQGTQGYLGDDLTVFATHLFESITLTAWEYQQIPHSIAWAVRSDGVLLGLTYLKEHEICAWHRHDTDGVYEDVCVVPEGAEDAVYVIVKRTINGATKRYLERFSSRVVTDVAVDAHFVDCYLSYDGRNVSATTMTLSGGTTWDHNEQETLTASAAFFSAGDVGSGIVLRITTTTYTPEKTTVSTVSVLLIIEAYTSTTVVTVRPEATVDVTLRTVALTTWNKAVKAVSGLSHLEAKAVAILADGQVLTNGIDTPLTVVTGGAVSFDRPYSVVHVGLPYVSDLETLDLDIVNGETLTDKEKRVNSVELNLEASRGLFVGETLSTLTELAPDVPDYGVVMPLITDKRDIRIQSTWNLGGRIAVRQRNPLPATILAVVPHVNLGG